MQACIGCGRQLSEITWPALFSHRDRKNKNTNNSNVNNINNIRNSAQK